MSQLPESPGDTMSATCTDCPAAGATRRAFFRDVGVMIATLLAGGAVASPAMALVGSISETRPTAVRGLLHTYTLPSSDSIQIDDGNDVILARWQSHVYAFSLKCPHRGTRLQWHANEQRIYCPKHKARFTPGGVHDSGRRSRDLDRLAISRRGDAIVVDLGTILRGDVDRAAWQAAVIVL
ncbi:MAG TPA: Rieske 2Fe-2S domain-containing protein [Gemmatimonadaceae bacterium]|nr:Rieske 2Fe-2S domain-containing protein [Gemmatimonadaceae bacterium]